MENKNRQIKEQKERRIAKYLYIMIVVIVLAAAVFFMSIGKSLDNQQNIPSKNQEIDSNNTTE